MTAALADLQFIEIRLSNAPKHNALTPRMMLDLAAIVDRLETDADFVCDQTAAIILTGDGRSFCAGLGTRHCGHREFQITRAETLKPCVDLSAARAQLTTATAGYHMCTVMTDTLTRLRALPVLSVAAVRGHAMGGGAELTTACDMRLMAHHARIQFVQARMGVTPGWGGMVSLFVD